MIHIITDSTGYLPDHIIEKYDLTVVPLKVQFGSDSYDETVGITNQEFYERLSNTDNFPTTSQPTVGEFQAAYKNILDKDPDAEILVITISSKLSGTYNSASTAAKQLPEINITVFDSLSTAMGIEFMVVTATDMARKGNTMEQIMTRLEEIREDHNILLVVDTLEYLRKGGRIGAAQALLGTLLNTKPILAVIDGKVEPLDRVRTKKKAINRMLDEVERRLGSKSRPMQAGVMHIAAQKEAERLAEQVKQQFNVTRAFTSELGPVVGAHVGPGTVGIGFVPERET